MTVHRSQADSLHEAVAAERERCVRHLDRLAAWHASQAQKTAHDGERAHHMAKCSALAEAADELRGDEEARR